jgi:hypothetical protein
MIVRWQRMVRDGVPSTDECGAIIALLTITVITIATTLGVSF